MSLKKKGKRKKTSPNKTKEKKLSPETEDFLSQLERERWERIVKGRAEWEREQAERKVHEAKAKKLMPKLDKMSLKQLKAHIKKHGPIDLDYDMDRHDKYRTPENIIAGRKLGLDVESTGYYFERKEIIKKSQKYAEKRHAHRQKVLKTLTKEQREAANKALGSVSIRANEESSRPGHRGRYDSVDYLNAEELKKLTPIRVDWDRDWDILHHGYRDGKPRLVLMSPDDFLSFSHTLHEGITSDISIRLIKEGVRDDAVFPVPFIYRGKSGAATGEHEGRHRAKAFKELGIKLMPVLIYDETEKNGDLTEWSGASKLEKEYDDYRP